MFEKIINFSISNKPFIGFLVVFLIGYGIYSLTEIPIDAVPDITNNQVQVVTTSPSLSPQEVEKFITYPLEITMANIKDVIEIRSVSRYGLSVVTIVFGEQVPILDARQLVNEQIQMAVADIPPSMGTPEMLPITTGLGEVFQYTLEVEEEYRNRYSPTELRTIHDWIVKRQLSGIPGIVEISSFGGFLKQYEVAVDPLALKNLDITITDVHRVLSENNENTGGSYIERGNNTFYIRAEGLIESIEDIGNIVVKNTGNTPVLIRNIATVGFGAAPRFGAMTKDGKGEAVGGITLMLKGANSSEVVNEVKRRVDEVQQSLPPGVFIKPYLDRAQLVERTIGTVTENLVLGGLIVIFVLVLLLGHLRSGLIVASVIPLSLLFAFIMMRIFDVSANLMSLGAIDFGIVIDGAVIIVENIVHQIYRKFNGQTLDQKQIDTEVGKAASSIYKSAAFGVIIILIVFIPIMTLSGIEGKMFKPMAQTFSFVILGAFILSLTYVPMMSALTLKKNVRRKRNFSDRIIDFLKSSYVPVLKLCLRFKYLILSTTVVVFGISLVIFSNMGGEFLPTLEEGDLAMQMTIPPGSSLEQSIRSSTKAEKILLENFPEVISVVSKIGTAEVPTDPMAIEDADIMIVLRPKDDWTTTGNREELIERMKEKLASIPEASFEFTQPIQLRFNELMTGVKTDVAVKIYGEDLDELFDRANEAASLISGIPGASDIKVEQITGLPQYVIRYDRARIARYGINISDLNDLVRTSFAGKSAGVVFEGERRFDLVVRLDPDYRNEIIPENLFIRGIRGNQVALSEVAKIEYMEGPAQISRDDTKRRVTIGINVRNRDVESLVEEINTTLSNRLDLKPGYYITYGGQFENLENARKRLKLAVPAALLMILILLFFTFNSVKYALLIFTAVPLSAVGGIFALLIRGMPFSISAGVGFIALFGIAVLNGIVLISYYNELRQSGMQNIRDIVEEGAISRLRPVLMTAITDVLGFLPMAISTSAGAEVQRPLATVVIGGVITSTLLTMIILPILYNIFNSPPKIGLGKGTAVSLMIAALLMVPLVSNAQPEKPDSAITLNRNTVTAMVLSRNPGIRLAELEVEKGRAAVSEAWEMPATDFLFQKGQINSSVQDQYLEVSQSLGPLLKNIRSVQHAKTQVAILETEKWFKMRNTLKNGLLAYEDWRYLTELTEISRSQLEKLNSYSEVARAKYELGDIGLLEKTLLETEFHQFVFNTESLKNQAEKQEEMLKYQLFTNMDLMPEMPGYSRFPTGRPLDSLSLEIDSVMISWYRLKDEKSRKNLQVSRSAFFPEISAGYFNQHIDNATGFEGWQVGLSFPLFFIQQSSRVKQAKIEAEITGNQTSMGIMDFRTTLANRLREYRNLEKKYEFYQQVALPNSRLLRETAEKRYLKGEIEYLEFLESLRKSLEIEKESLLTLNQLNKSLIELIYVTPDLTN